MVTTSSYRQTLDYLFQQLPMYQRVGPPAFKKDLTNTLRLLDHLGHPHRLFPSIHIAGTNGKGSVAHMLAAIFSAAGYRTGLYTSPHYRDFRERVKIDGNLIPKKAVVRFVQDNREAFEPIQPSFFEWTVALAFDHFAREKVDIAIIETGLGGRLDSTNVVTPMLSVITNIGFDHMQFLGDTLPLIAGEKAGIIKPCVPVVIGETQAETTPVFLQKAASTGSAITFADQEYQVEPVSTSNSHSVFRVNGQPGKYFSGNLTLNHTGHYQRQNLCTTLEAMDVFIKTYPEWEKDWNRNVRSGLENMKELTRFIGRWEFIREDPRVLCDSAHNEEGLKLAMEGLQRLEFDDLHIVIGLVNDKPPEKILKWFPRDARYYFCKANIPRGLDAKVLRDTAIDCGLNGKSYSSVRKALAAARSRAKKNDLIYVGGSIFVVAEVI